MTIDCMTKETNKPQRFYFNEYSIILCFCFLAAKKGSKSSVPGSSCEDILISGESEGDGEYWIDPADSGDPFTVFCDMKTDQGALN